MPHCWRVTNKIFVLALGAILLAFTQIQQLSDGRKGLEKNRNNPTVLFGYGGFDISETPTFTPAIAVWLEMGGIYALANIRRGGEYGEEWHLAGTKPRKQNVFDDFIAACEWLE